MLFTAKYSIIPDHTCEIWNQSRDRCTLSEFITLTKSIKCNGKPDHLFVTLDDFGKLQKFAVLVVPFTY